MTTIIISAYRATNSMEQNIDNHYELRQYLKHSHVFTNTVRDCMGYYREDEQSEPSREVSVCAVALSRHHGEQIAHQLAAKYEQDAFCWLITTIVFGFAHALTGQILISANG